MDNSQSCGHITCLLKLRLGPYANLTFLVAAGIVVLIAVIGLKTCAGFSEANDVKNAALEFAKDFKNAEDTARDTKRVLTVQVIPGQTYNAPTTYTVYDGEQKLQERTLPEAISGNGHARLDPDGVPLLPAVFQFRKGSHTVKVAVDTRGNVSFPTD